MELELFTVNDFCAAHSISRATFYRLLRDGRGPKTSRLGERLMISKQAAAEWRAQLEAATAALATRGS